MNEAAASLDRFYDTADRLHRIHPGKAVSDAPDGIDEAGTLKELLERFDENFDAVMNDDFNTARAVGCIFDVVRGVNRYLDAMKDRTTPFAGWVVLQFVHLQHVAGDVLGIFGSCAEDYISRSAKRITTSKGIDPAVIERLIEERKQARAAKDFARADDIRRELTDKGVEIKDRPGGTTEWRFK